MRLRSACPVKASAPLTADIDAPLPTPVMPRLTVTSFTSFQCIRAKFAMALISDHAVSEAMLVAAVMTPLADVIPEICLGISTYERTIPVLSLYWDCCRGFFDSPIPSQADLIPGTHIALCSGLALGAGVVTECSVSTGEEDPGIMELTLEPGQFFEAEIVVPLRDHSGPFRIIKDTKEFIMAQVVAVFPPEGTTCARIRYILPQERSPLYEYEVCMDSDTVHPVGYAAAAGHTAAGLKEAITNENQNHIQKIPSQFFTGLSNKDMRKEVFTVVRYTPMVYEKGVVGSPEHVVVGSPEHVDILPTYATLMSSTRIMNQDAPFFIAYEKDLLQHDRSVWPFRLLWEHMLLRYGTKAPQPSLIEKVLYFLEKGSFARVTPASPLLTPDFFDPTSEDPLHPSPASLFCHLTSAGEARGCVGMATLSRCPSLDIPDINSISLGAGGCMKGEGNDDMFPPPWRAPKSSRNLARLLRHPFRCSQLVSVVSAPWLSLDMIQTTIEASTSRTAKHGLALHSLAHLLVTVTDKNSLHSLLWHFVRCLSLGQPWHVDDTVDVSLQVGLHPMVLIGSFSSTLRRLFHRVLDVVLTLVLKLPGNSDLQRLAVRCFGIKFHPRDYFFLYQSQVFVAFSSLLAAHEQNLAISLRGSPVSVVTPNDITRFGVISVSSRPAMLASLSDKSTETFWESGDEDKARSKWIHLSFAAGDPDIFVAEICVYLDSVRDKNNATTLVELKMGVEVDERVIVSRKVTAGWCGWLPLVVPAELRELCGHQKQFRLEFTGAVHIRIRQVKVLTAATICVAARTTMCEVRHRELLYIFKDLTTQIFETVGDVAISEIAVPVLQEDSTACDSIISTSYPVHRLQQQICSHLVREFNLETIKLMPGAAGPPHDDHGTSSLATLDMYCFELLTIISSLCSSPSGAKFVSRVAMLVADLVLHLVHGTIRNQRLVCTILGLVLPSTGPDYLDPGLPNASSGLLSGVVPLLLMPLAQVLDMQVRMSGQERGGGVKQFGDFCHMEGSVLAPWCRKEPIAKEVGHDIVHLLKRLLVLPAWRGCMEQRFFDLAANMAVVSGAPEVSSHDCLALVSFWLGVASLCVINEAVVALANATHTTVVEEFVGCSNHDDALTPAQIRCATCDCLLCFSCDTILHLPKGSQKHRRTVLETPECCNMYIELSDTNGRLKQKHFMALADVRNFMTVVEFRTYRGHSNLQCRFCKCILPQERMSSQLKVNDGLENVCADCGEVEKLAKHPPTGEAGVVCA